MAMTLVGARPAPGRELWESDCLPFLDHVLSPLDLCRRQDASQHGSMIKATRLFLTTAEGDAASLPAPASFGDTPVIVVDLNSEEV